MSTMNDEQANADATLREQRAAALDAALDALSAAAQEYRRTSGMDDDGAMHLILDRLDAAFSCFDPHWRGSVRLTYVTRSPRLTLAQNERRRNDRRGIVARP